MSLEENKEIVRSLSEVLNERNLALLDELMTPNYFHHTLRIKGLESFKQNMTLIYKGFPDWHETIEDIIAEGDKVWVRYTDKMTHTGEYRGLAPTGKKVTYTGVGIWRIVDGKIVEGWEVGDMLDIYKQLGVIEYKGFPDEVT